MIVRSYAAVVQRIEAALSRCARLRVWRKAKFETGSGGYTLYCLKYTPVTPDSPLIYLSAGIHGDEPAGVACALEVLDKLADGDPDFAPYGWLISPCDNPFGYERNLRESESGIDLNRVFDAPERFPQTAFVAASLAGVDWERAMDLHEDSESGGFYLWERRPSSKPPFGYRIIARVEKICPINREPEIEGHKNDNGVVTLLDHAGSKGWTRGHYLGESLVSETPTRFALETRIAAHLEVIRTVLDSPLPTNFFPNP
jgi:hypothetical protein